MKPKLDFENEKLNNYCRFEFLIRKTGLSLLHSCDALVYTRDSPAIKYAILQLHSWDIVWRCKGKTRCLPRNLKYVAAILDMLELWIPSVLLLVLRSPLQVLTQNNYQFWTIFIPPFIIFKNHSENTIKYFMSVDKHIRRRNI